MFLLRKFCCLLKLRTGCYLIAVVDLIINLNIIIFSRGNIAAFPYMYICTYIIYIYISPSQEKYSHKLSAVWPFVIALDVSC